MSRPKSVLIIGCSEGGIGDALAQEFQKKGFRVFATARNTTRIAHLKDMGMATVALDVVSKDSIARAVEVVGQATGGPLDFLVNNSGAGYAMPVMDVDIDMAKKCSMSTSSPSWLSRTPSHRS